MGKSAAKGAILQVKNVTWQTIPQVGDINFAPFNVDRIDVTTQDSPNNTEEKIPGIKKAAKQSYPIVWDDANAVHAFLLANNGVTLSFSYQGAGAVAAYKFNAISELAFENGVKGAKKATLSLELSDGNTPT
jgi:hypothetical protein